MSKVRTSENIIALIYNKDDAKNFLHSNIIVSAILPLTPVAHSILIDNAKTTILDPIKIYTDYSHRRVISEVRNSERIINPLIDNNHYLSQAGKETFKNIFHPSLSQALYFMNLLRKKNTWLIYDEKKWKKTNDCFFIIKKFLFQNSNTIVVFEKNKFFIQKFQFFTNIINKIILKSHSNKKHIWTTGLVYGLKELTLRLQKNDPKTVFFQFSPVDKFSLFRTIKSIFLSFKLFNKNKNIILTPVLKNNKNYNKVSSSVRNIIKKSLSKKNEQLLDILSEFIIGSIHYTESINDYTNDIFKIYQPHCLLAHHLRWMEASALGNISKKLDIPIYLISHSTHAVPENLTSAYEHLYNAKGMLISPFISRAIVQSPSADKLTKILSPKLKRDPFQPIMWGFRKFNKIPKQKKDKFVILHTGTYKTLSGRPWIYETPNEYLFGLKKLVKAIESIKNINMIIRVRDNIECGAESLKILLPKTKNSQIKTDGNFFKDLELADLLISFSSTTIEEALYARKPVALFGGSMRYRHFPGTSIPPRKNKRNAVYHLNSNNLEEMLIKIQEAHSFNLLSNEELKDYIWDKNIPNYEKFVHNVLTKT